jgi:hypothetical protein
LSALNVLSKHYNVNYNENFMIQLIWPYLSEYSSVKGLGSEFAVANNNVHVNRWELALCIVTTDVNGMPRRIFQWGRASEPNEELTGKDQDYFYLDAWELPAETYLGRQKNFKIGPAFNNLVDLLTVMDDEKINFFVAIQEPPLPGKLFERVARYYLAFSWDKLTYEVGFLPVLYYVAMVAPTNANLSGVKLHYSYAVVYSVNGKDWFSRNYVGLMAEKGFPVYWGIEGRNQRPTLNFNEVLQGDGYQHIPEGAILWSGGVDQPWKPPTPKFKWYDFLPWIGLIALIGGAIYIAGKSKSK